MCHELAVLSNNSEQTKLSHESPKNIFIRYKSCRELSMKKVAVASLAKIPPLIITALEQLKVVVQIKPFFGLQMHETLCNF